MSTRSGTLGAKIRHKQSAVSSIPKILWRLSSSDILTFVLPNTLFGICTSLCMSMWAEPSEGGGWALLNFINKWHGNSTASLPIFGRGMAARFLKTLIWNWMNLVLFNLSNQRLPDAVAEDKLNKPYRPIPSGLVTPTGARRSLLYGILAVVLLSYLWVGAYEESIIMVGLTWMYNDLRGGDENFIMRNLVIAISFGVYNHASSRIAHGYSDVTLGNASWGTSTTNPITLAPKLSLAGQHWVVLMSLIVFTTIQIQDLKDVEGDKQRGRRTLMLVAGMRMSRWLTALPIFIWTIIIPFVLQLKGLSLPLVAMVGLGFYAAWRVMFLKSKAADNDSWKVWALWLIAIYSLPLVV